MASIQVSVATIAWTLVPRQGGGLGMSSKTPNSVEGWKGTNAGPLGPSVLILHNWLTLNDVGDVGRSQLSFDWRSLPEQLDAQ